MRESIRLGICHNGDTTLRIPMDGTPISFTDGGPTDEGYSFSSERYAFAPEEHAIYLEVTSEGRDCDGYSSSYSDLVLPIGYAPGYGYPRNERGYPEWERVETGQRDYTAEAEGY